MNILFLERDREARRLVKDMLAGAGATLVEIGSAGAFDPGAASPRIAIVDVGEDTDGLALIAQLRARGPDRPAILAITAEPGLAEPSHAAGADEVLAEPVAMTTLFDAIARYLPVG